MGLTVTHTFVSAKADSADATLIQPSNWNAGHTVVDTSGVFNVADFDYTAQTPGGSLAVGSNVITMSPLPDGVESGGIAYISGGTGTAEAVPITGVSGNDIIVTCAYTHSGAWTIKSATAGIREALDYAGTTIAMFNITKSANIYGTIAVAKSCVINGSPSATLTWAGVTSGTMFSLSTDNITIQNIIAVLGTATYGITNSGSINNIQITGCTLSGSALPIQFTQGSRFYIQRNTISGYTSAGINIMNAGDPTAIQYNYLLENYVDATSVTLLNGGGIGCWGNYSVFIGNHIKLGGNQAQGLLWINNVSAGLKNCVIALNTITVETSNTFEGIGVASARAFSITGNTIIFNGTLSGAGFIGIEVNQCSNGTVVGNAIRGNNPSVPVTGILLISTTLVKVSGNTIDNYGTNTSCVGIGISHGDNANTASGQCSYNTVSDNTIRQLDASAVNYCISFDTLTTGNVLGNVIRGNTIIGNTTTGFIGIKCANSGVATVTNTRIEDNHIFSCDVGIEIAGTDSWVLNNSLIGCTTKYTDSGTTSKIVDRANTVFATLASGTSVAASTASETFSVTGTTTITTITGGWVGRRIRLTKADSGSVTVGGGGNIPGSHTLAQYGGLDLVFDGTNWY